MNRSITLAAPRHDPVGKADTSSMQRWMVAICAIRFDLQQGQLVEECYPPNVLSPEEELDVAFSSFPDSMSQGSTHASVHDCAFFFRIRRRGTIPAPNPAPPRRTISHPSSDTFVEAVDDTARELNCDGPQGVQNSISEGCAALEKSSADEEGGTGSGWGSLPLSSILANVISPKPATRVTSSSAPTLSSNNPPTTLAVRREENTNLPGYSLDAVKGSSRGGPGSGGPRYLYGFVFNRQRQDERLRRGGEQKSVVILSERPYSCVFKPLVQIAGPMYFDIGARALEQIASYVSRWAPPLHGQLMELLVGTVVIRAHLPPAHALPPGCGTPMDDFTSAMAPVPPLNRSVPQGVFHDVDLFGSFRGVLMNLWVLWELLLVGEPLLVVGPTPPQVCEAVAALVGLVAPLPCSVDFRPYFTIHDPDFGGLNSVKEGEKALPMVLGVTNLFFLKALRNIPHVISVGTPTPTPTPSLLKLARSNNNSQAGNRRLSLQLQLSPLTRFSPANLLQVARVRKDGPLSLMSEHRECLWTSYVTATKPDTSVLNRLVDAGVSPRTEESMSMVNNEVLRRHFLELTTNFLAPFGPYLRATTPQEGASPFRDPPPLPPFNAHSFLEGLAARGAGKFLAKRLRANWLDLYRRFLEGPNFMPWFQRRRAVAEQEQHRIWRQARCKADVESFLKSMSEVEIVDSFSAVERHLIIELQMLQRAGLANTQTQTIKKLRSDLRTIFNSLPNDVQQMLLTNPQRASHLQGGQPEIPKTPEKSPSKSHCKSPPRFGFFWPTFESSQSDEATPERSSTQQELLQDPLDLNRT